MTPTLRLLELSLYEGYGALALTHGHLNTWTRAVDRQPGSPRGGLVETARTLTLHAINGFSMWQNRMYLNPAREAVRMHARMALHY